MKFKNVSISFLLLAFFVAASAQANSIPSQMSFEMGSISSSYAENPDKLEATDGTASTKATAYSSTASALPLGISYEYFPNLKRSYLIKGVGPLVASSDDRYFSATIGVNFYFGMVASQAVVSDFNFSMKMIPKLRYYVGPSLGVGYLVYNTKSATKNDLLFEIGGQGGAIYTINPKWGLKAELGFSRGIGVLVSATTIKIMFGGVYNLGN